MVPQLPLVTETMVKDAWTILIVEDDDSFREMLRTVLEARGLNVLVAANTGEGLELAATHGMDAIVSDFQMPKTNGLEFCRAVRRQNEQLGRRVPVWLMTGTDTLTEKEAKAAGAVGILRKPFRVIDITKIIERYLQREMSSSTR
jgi:CheY-like chemotaxis protein